MPPMWDLNATEMKEKLAEARKAGSTRLYALAYASTSPVQWHHRKDEDEMRRHLDSRDESESMLFSAAVAVVVVNPQDSDETIEVVLKTGHARSLTGPGYFSESF